MGAWMAGIHSSTRHLGGGAYCWQPAWTAPHTSEAAQSATDHDHPARLLLPTHRCHWHGRATAECKPGGVMKNPTQAAEPLRLQQAGGQAQAADDSSTPCHLPTGDTMIQLPGVAYC
jgi:hypothetical protein